MKGASQLRRRMRYSWIPKKILCLALFLSWIQVSQAQDSLKAFRSAFTQCEDWIQRGKPERAYPCYLELRKQYPNQIKPLIRLAELAYQQKDKAYALLFANEAVDKDPTASYAAITHLAKRMQDLGDDTLAMKIMNRLLVSNLDSAKRIRTEETRKKMLVPRLTGGPQAGVQLRNLGDSVNTPENEYLPCLSMRGDQLVFTRNQKGNEDFFVSRKDSTGKWQPAVNMGYPPNTGLPDGGAMLSADGNYLFFTRCDMRSPNGIESGGCDIAFSFREDGSWSSPQYFGFTINTTAYEGQPCLSSNNLDLYFVSNREGGYGGMDIWVSHFENNFWSKPENLGPMVNSPGNEGSPYIHPDNETLYFSSDGLSGYGGSDLFVTHHLADGSWKKALNLGKPVNSEGFDGSVSIDALGRKGYSASDRKDGKGGLDIYEFDLYSAIRPIPTVCIEGVLTDKFFGHRMHERSVRWIDLRSGKTIREILSNEGDASYSVFLHAGRNYLLEVQEEGFRPFYKKLSIPAEPKEPIIHQNIRMRQPGYIDTLLNAIIEHDTLSGAPSDSALALLDSLAKKWPEWTEDSAFVNITLTSYYYCCDSLTDSLYEARLEACLNRIRYLQQFFERRGIPCERIMPSPSIFIYNDEAYWFRRTEIQVIENY